jgi:dihydrodipicolinate synthase/N-acetylneuraminate lyase
VVTGTDNLLEAALGHGNGCILASGNIYAKYIADVFTAHRAGSDIKPAIARLTAVQGVYRTAMGATAGGGGGGEGVNKYALSKFLGINAAYVRPPAVPAADDMKPKIEAAIQQVKTYA